FGPFFAGPYNGTTNPPPPVVLPAEQQPKFPVGGAMHENHRVTTDSASIFAVGKLNITSQLSISLSGRYTREKRVVDYIREVPAGLGVGEIDPTSPVTLAGGI